MFNIMTWIDLLDEIKKVEEQYGETMNRPLPVETILKKDKKQSDIIKNFLETDYSRFLTKVNGIDFDGSVLYGISEKDTDSLGFYDIFYYNDIWHEVEENKQYFFIGENNISWFVFKPSENSFLELDMPSADVVREFKNLDELLTSFLKDALE